MSRLLCPNITPRQIKPLVPSLFLLYLYQLLCVLNPYHKLPNQGRSLFIRTVYFLLFALVKGKAFNIMRHYYRIEEKTLYVSIKLY